MAEHRGRATQRRCSEVREASGAPSCRVDLSVSERQAAQRPVRDRLRARRRLRGRRSTVPACRTRSSSPASTTRAQRRKSGEDFIVHPVGVARICASMRLDTETLCAALLHDTVEDTSASIEEVRERFGEEIAAIVDGVTKLTGHHLPVPRRGAGQQLPQDDGRDGHRRAGHPDQARRPPAQHAHDRGDAQAEADREGARDARDLRAARPPARDPRDQVGARGPRLRDAAPAQVPGDQGPRRPAARRARALRRPRPASTCARELERGRHRGADRRARQALLLDLLEDDQEGPRVQRDLRPHGDAGDRRLGEGLLRRGRGDPLAVEAAAGALQGLHRDAEVQHVPVAAHDGDRARGTAAGDPDPHPRDARDGRVRRRRALGLQAPAGAGEERGSWQAARRGRQAEVAALDARLAEGALGPARVHGDAAHRPLRGGGLRLHAQGRGQARSPPARRRWTSPTRSTPRSATAASARA